jgi:hypothetical protein
MEEKSSGEESVEEPKGTAVRLIKEGKMGFDEISQVTGLPRETVWGLKGMLVKSGQLHTEKEIREEPPRRQEGKPDPLQDMRDEMSRTLEEELMSVPGASEKASAYILKRFASDDELIFDAYRLHALIARFNPRLSDADVVDIVQRVQRVAESFHLERLRGMGTLQSYRVGSRPQGHPDYDVRAGLMPGYGQQSLRTFTESDVATERRFWLLESKVEKVDSGLGEINRGLEDLSRKLDEKPKTSTEDEAVKTLTGKIEQLGTELKLREKELDEKDKTHLREELGSLKEEVKGLRSNLGEWRTDEYKLIGQGLEKLTDFGREVLKEAPASRAAQQIATALMPQGGREVPPEARETVLSTLKREGLTVPE